jgi:hypothetical protein
MIISAFALLLISIQSLLSEEMWFPLLFYVASFLSRRLLESCRVLNSRVSGVQYHFQLFPFGTESLHENRFVEIVVNTFSSRPDLHCNLAVRKTFPLLPDLSSCSFVFHLRPNMSLQTLVKFRACRDLILVENLSQYITLDYRSALGLGCKKTSGSHYSSGMIS